MLRNCLLCVMVSVLLAESTQLEDPRVQWQREQELMLREYLSVAKEALSAQKEIYQVKEERLRLAQQQYKQLNDVWREKSSSQTSCKIKEGTFLIYSDTATSRTEEVVKEKAKKRRKDYQDVLKLIRASLLEELLEFLAIFELVRLCILKFVTIFTGWLCGYTEALSYKKKHLSYSR